AQRLSPGPGETGDRSAAARLEEIQQGAFRERLPVRGEVVNAPDELADGGVVRPRHDGERALPDGGEHPRRRQYLGDVLESLEPREARPRENERVPPALAESADPGV